MTSRERSDIIVRNAARLTYQERAEVARRILEDGPEPQASAAERYAELLPAAEETVGRHMTRARGFYDVMIRRFIAYKLRSEGYLFTDIADAMGKHYSTVMHYVRQMKDCFDEPIFYANDINLYMCFAEEADNDVE